MSTTLTIVDQNNGVRFRGEAITPTEDLTPAQQVAAFIQTNPEQIARLSWAWYAAKRKAERQVVSA